MRKVREREREKNKQILVGLKKHKHPHFDVTGNQDYKSSDFLPHI